MNRKIHINWHKCKVKEKSGNQKKKTKKNDKSQVKIDVFEKRQEIKFKKHQILSIQIY